MSAYGVCAEGHSTKLPETGDKQKVCGCVIEARVAEAYPGFKPEDLIGKPVRDSKGRMIGRVTDAAVDGASGYITIRTIIEEKEILDAALEHVQSKAPFGFHDDGTPRSHSNAWKDSDRYDPLG